MPAAFDELALRLANTVAAPWAQAALSYSPVDVSTYEVLFKQVGFVLPSALKAELATRGAFELCAVPDAEEHHETDDGVDASEALSDLRGPLWAGRNVLRGGVHLLSPAELFGTYRGQRLGTRGQVELGSLWVFAAPRGYVWVDAFALDARAGSSRVDGEYPVVPFHEDDMGEEFDLLEPDGSLRHARPSLDAWARWVSDEIENTVKALEAAGVTRVAAPPGPKGPAQVVDLAPYLAEVAQGQKWSSWVEAIWRQALRQGSVEAAQQVLRDVGTMVTRPSEADYKLPGALDLWHRLPRHGPFSRRAALAELWSDRQPEGDAETQVAFDVFLGSLEHDHVAPLAVFDALQPAAWSDRGLATAAATRWARALLWALGPARCCGRWGPPSPPTCTKPRRSCTGLKTATAATPNCRCGCDSSPSPAAPACCEARLRPRAHLA